MCLLWVLGRPGRQDRYAYLSTMMRQSDRFAQNTEAWALAGSSDRMIEVNQRHGSCRGQSIFLRIGPNGWILGQRSSTMIMEVEARWRASCQPNVPGLNPE